MRIAVLGAGALGCLVGSMLHRSGQSVLLIHHNKYVATLINKNGVSIKELSGRIVRTHIHTKSRLSRQDHPQLVLVTVKAYDTGGVALNLKRSIGPDVPVLSLQNGFGNIENLKHHLGSDSIIAGTTTESALSTAPGRVIHTGGGTTWIGEMNGRLSERCLAIKTAFRKARLPTVISENIHGVLWSKTIVNSAINPISALMRVRNGEVANVTELYDLAERVIDEGSAVARATGIRLRPSPKSLLSKVLGSTSENKSSMLQDIEARRKTEIQELNGSISRQGRLVKVGTPLNDLFTKLVLGLEHSQGYS